MSAHLAAAGYPVQTFDRAGHGNAASVREAVAEADVLITMLPDGGVVREVVLEAMPNLREGALVVDMSSADPAGTRALGRALAALGKEHELKLHINGSLNNGLTKDQIKEVFLQVAIYCGVPAAVVCFRCAREVFKERGV